MNVKCQFAFKDKGCTCESDPEWLSRFLNRIEDVAGPGVVWDDDDDDDDETEEAEE